MNLKEKIMAISPEEKLLYATMAVVVASCVAEIIATSQGTPVNTGIPTIPTPPFHMPVPLF